MIASSLAAMLMTAVVTGLMVVSHNVRANEAAIRARQSGTRAIELIMGKVRRAKEVTLSKPLPGGGFTTLVTFDNGVWDPATSDYSDVNGVFSEFSFEDGKLYFRRGVSEDAPRQPILSDVEGLVFNTSSKTAPNHDVTVEIRMAATKEFSNDDRTTFSLAGSTRVRSLELH